jgi:anti-anti-sigma regulatory factor
VDYDAYPVRRAGEQAVVTLPERIDVSNAGQIREELLVVINRGVATLIADMTATVSCDYAAPRRRCAPAGEPLPPARS